MMQWGFDGGDTWISFWPSCDSIKGNLALLGWCVTGDEVIEARVVEFTYIIKKGEIEDAIISLFCTSRRSSTRSDSGSWDA